MSTPSTEFALKAEDSEIDFTCVMSEELGRGGSRLETVVERQEDVLSAPYERKGNDVTSVFPHRQAIEFSVFDDSFIGAYKPRVEKSLP